ncbi:MAG: putative UDP-glucose 4-epimerase (NAD-dependent epimerase/dehydratase) [Acidimicrobiales bacterium]|nr:putative UDP-glucose 4-epimerase (NAD-dependent epimerase/dehydratase) [Acidimicrobiales bacterium]
MRVLVTGAGGLLGRPVVAELVRRGHEVRAVVRRTPVDDTVTVEQVHADLRRPLNADVLLGIDGVIHLAGGASSDEAEQFASTVTGTENLLAAMVTSGVRRIVLASSFTVYDWRAASDVLTEDSPLSTDLEARGSYTTAKAWQERITRRAAEEDGLEVTVLRPGIIWGPDNAYPPGITTGRGRVHVVFGLRSLLPLTYVENCADAFVFCLERPGTVGQTFNVVDGPGVAAWQYVGEYLRRTGQGGIRLPVPYRAGLLAARAAAAVNRLAFDGRGRLPSLLHEARFVARHKPLTFSSERLRAVGWVPPIGLAEALDRTFLPTAPYPAVEHR